MGELLEADWQTGASGAVMAVMAVFIWYFPKQTVLLWGVLPVPAWALGVLYFMSDIGGAVQGGGQVAKLPMWRIWLVRSSVPATHGEAGIWEDSTACLIGLC